MKKHKNREHAIGAAHGFGHSSQAGNRKKRRFYYGNSDFTSEDWEAAGVKGGQG